MATILRGKLKGTEARVIQWCNDWFMLEPGGITSPTSIQLTQEEIRKVRECGNNGIMFSLFTLDDTGRFRRRKIAIYTNKC